MARWRHRGALSATALCLALLGGCGDETVYAYDPVGPRQQMTGPQAQAECQRRGMEAQRAHDQARAGSGLPGYNAVYEPCMAEMGWSRRVVRHATRWMN